MPGSSTRSNSISLDAIQDVQVYIAPYDVKLGNFWEVVSMLSPEVGVMMLQDLCMCMEEMLLLPGITELETIPKCQKTSDFIYGGRVGLPIVRDKVFLFTNLEYTKE
jgi:hypothetical protein